MDDGTRGESGCKCGNRRWCNWRGETVDSSIVAMKNDDKHIYFQYKIDVNGIRNYINHDNEERKMSPNNERKVFNE